MVLLVAAAPLVAGCSSKNGGAADGGASAGDAGDDAGSDAAPCSVDLQTDPNNCGACNVKCSVGSQCVDGKCAGYTIQKPFSVAWADACTLPNQHTVLQNSAGQTQWAATSDPIPIGFTFVFYGTSYTQAWIANQGTLGLGAYPSSASVPSCPLPVTSDGYPAIIPFGDQSLELTTSSSASDGGAGASAVCYATEGTAPNREFVVTWENLTEDQDSGSVLTFSVMLSESSNTIDLAYHTAKQGMNGGAYVDGVSALVGLQGDAKGMAYTQISGCGQEIYPKAPYGIHLTPAM